MTSTDPPVMVTLPDRFQVPQRFTIQLRGWLRRTPVTCEVSVEMDHRGKRHLRALTLAVTDPDGPPLSPDDLADFNAAEVLKWAVQQEAMRHTPMPWSVPAADSGEPMRLSKLIASANEAINAHSAAALTATSAAGDRRRITPDDLRRVLELHNAKGVQGVIDEMKCSERHARRLLARARRELA